MKIAFVVGDITSTGGIERAVSRVSDLLIRFGYEVDIISLFKGNEKLYYNFNSSINIDYLSNEKYASLPQGGGRRWTMFIKNLNKFKSQLKKINNIDIYIGCGFPVNFVLFFSGLSYKSIASEHTYYGYYSNLITSIRNSIYKRFLCVTALTHRDTELFMNQNIKCITIPNPITFKSDKLSNLSEKKIIAVGRLSPEKGFEDLISVMPDVIKECPGWSLHIFGEGYLRKDLENLINTLNLSGKVFLRGNSSNIKEEYLKSSLFVLSSRYEGFAIVLLEAAACGLPIISYDCPNGPKEILNNDKGILVPLNDRHALCSNIISLIKDNHRKLYYAKRSMDILCPFSDSKIYNHWNNLFMSLDKQISK